MNRVEWMRIWDGMARRLAGALFVVAGEAFGQADAESLGAVASDLVAGRRHCAGGELVELARLAANGVGGAAALSLACALHAHAVRYFAVQGAPEPPALPPESDRARWLEDRLRELDMLERAAVATSCPVRLAPRSSTQRALDELSGGGFSGRG